MQVRTCIYSLYLLKYYLYGNTLSIQFKKIGLLSKRCHVYLRLAYLHKQIVSRCHCVFLRQYLFANQINIFVKAITV